MARRDPRAGEVGAAIRRSIGLPIGMAGLLFVLFSGVLDPIHTRPDAASGRVDPDASEPAPQLSVIRSGLSAVDQTVGDPDLPVRVTSDFAGALNGWAFGRGEDNSRLEHRLQAGSDGARGFLRFHDGDMGMAAYLRMASVHTGRHAALFGGEIRFDLRVTRGGAWIGDRTPLLRFTGENGRTMTYRHGVPPGREGWTRIAVPVRPEGWRIDGRAATEAGMRAILDAVATAEIRIEQAHGSDEVIDLDTVEFVGRYGAGP